jgi:hypothetical protein
LPKRHAAGARALPLTASLRFRPPSASQGLPPIPLTGESVVDFIDKIASVSSTTGKPYLIRFGDGREMKGADYLKAELKK